MNDLNYAQKYLNNKIIYTTFLVPVMICHFSIIECAYNSQIIPMLLMNLRHRKTNL
jgi:hypothetical protein